MNCKKGDLAVMVRSDFPENIGAFFKVLDRHMCDAGEWRVRALSTVHNDRGVDHAGSVGYALDADLRPIRDPGDDAVDETLLWLPVPVKETA